MTASSNIRKICVMGGSFNPPTLAHLRLMLAAVETLNADMGLFVPSGQKYVSNKMKRCNPEDNAFSEEVRLEMLTAMCRGNRQLRVDSVEFGRDGKWKTFETMEAIQEKYPRAELWFLAGGDKLPVIPHWHRSEEFLQRFHIFAIDREDEPSESAISENPLLSRYRDRFRIIKAPETVEGISSTRVRELLRNGDQSASEMVHPTVWDILLAEGWLSQKITSFRGEFDFLSNFYETSIEYGGLHFGSGEAAFQAQKCVDQAKKLTFQNMRPSEAKRAGRRVLLRSDWEQVKVRLMEEIVRAKFTQNPELAHMLLVTGNRFIQEGNTWNDTFWGVDFKTGEGKNYLGIILMKIREELRCFGQK